MAKPPGPETRGSRAAVASPQRRPGRRGAGGGPGARPGPGGGGTPLAHKSSGPGSEVMLTVSGGSHKLVGGFLGQ